jgi:hypothetical protein
MKTLTLDVVSLYPAVYVMEVDDMVQRDRDGGAGRSDVNSSPPRARRSNQMRSSVMRDAAQPAPELAAARHSRAAAAGRELRNAAVCAAAALGRAYALVRFELWLNSNRFQTILDLVDNKPSLLWSTTSPRAVRSCASRPRMSSRG